MAFENSKISSMNSEHSDIDDRLARINSLAAAHACLLLVGANKSPQTVALRQTARLRQWLVLDVDLIHAENGPWMGAAMPGSTNGCGIFAAAEAREFLARSDTEGIYLSATLDQLLCANGVRIVHLVNDAPACFVDAIRSFAVAHGYEFRVGPPGEKDGSTVDALRPLVRDLASRVAPENAALVLIDFQNDFCAISGAAGRTGASMRMVTAAVDRTRELLRSARARGIFVVHVRAEYGRPWRSSSSPYRFPVEGRREPAVWTASASDRSINRWFEEDDTEVCRTGTWGAEFAEGLCPEPGEAIITKHRFGAFAGTGLDKLLRARGLSSLIVAGVTTNCCVETTAREAVMREFSLIVVEDCVGVKDHLEDLHKATLEALGTYFGLVRPASDIIAEWDGRPLKGRKLEQ
jgi:nicotinamidase-related amidase